MTVNMKIENIKDFYVNGLGLSEKRAEIITSKGIGFCNHYEQGYIEKHGEKKFLELFSNWAKGLKEHSIDLVSYD